MSGRISSGNANLDAILGGGMPENAINIVMGLPGSGKTILAQQIAFHNATPERPALYLSTVSEPLEKILRYGRGLDYFDEEEIGRSVFYEDLGFALDEGALTALMDRILDLVRERRPGVIVIDSFKALHPYATDEEAFRRFLHGLSGRLSAFPATSVWVGEYAPDEMASAPEFAVADAILSLGTHRIADRESRVLQVFKLRGSTFLAGRHAYRLSNAGISVFPRLADPVDHASYDLDEERISTGIALLDDAIMSGYWSGASTLVAGPSGCGKTLMGLHFVFEGATSGEPVIIATFQENPSQLERIVGGFGWTLAQEGVTLMYRSPVDLYVDEWVHELLDAMERTAARRVMIDSLGDLQAAAGDEIRFREYVYSILQRASRMGTSIIMTQEVPELFGSRRLSEYGISHLSDNVILLQYVQGAASIRRQMAIMKTRASAHDPRVREFEITPNGIEVVSRPPGD